ncbi:LLM class flavin-dependent oxidoreductase [Pseudonocardia asaccharolytica]|uniref:Luciferase-like protein n=1 Tax=Pseudonocardia asaccharolytica DSM 44247 = NBRC 16224 TaxID=1123024 RepID=A0A511D2V0_9PSEU|nr:LLM class flavin-dependent oxidoreductase [Pseudonocardia asaccharolytica]GEL17904.1 luciferase-like protein [Pseudonocardia asaccharolytica DSM 44247 = NBRC 16224]
MTERLGVAVHGGTLATAALAARRAEERGFEPVWTTEFYDRSATVSLAAMAAATSTVTIASGIAYAVGRSPLVLTAEARDLDELSGGRLILGLGTGTRRMQQDWHGADGSAPAPRVEELVGLLRRIWAMGPSGVRHEGRFYRMALQPTVEVTPREPVPVYLAGFNPRMVAAAGAVADGLVGHPIFTRRYVDEVVRPALHKGAATTGRNPDIPIAGYVICSVAEDGDRARRDAAAQIAFYSVVRTYRRLIELEGFEASVAAIREAWSQRDADAMIAAVTPGMLGRIAVAGTPDEARDQLVRCRGRYDRLLCYAPSYGLSGAELTDRLDAIIDTFGR